MLGQTGPFSGIAQMVQNGNPQRCAMINSTTNIVETVIIADPAIDPAPDGYILVALPADSPAWVGWIYDPVTQTFTDPNPQPEPTPAE